MKDLADSKYKVFGWQVQWEDGTPCANICPYAAADIVDEVTHATSKFIWKCGTLRLRVL